MINNMDMVELYYLMVISNFSVIFLSFQGQWKNDKAFGVGKYVTLDGTIYNGDWIDDK